MATKAKATYHFRVSAKELDAMSLFVKYVAQEMPDVLLKPRKTESGDLVMVSEFPAHLDTWDVGKVMAKAAVRVQKEMGIHILPE